MTAADHNPPLLELAPPELAVPLKLTHAGCAYRVGHRLRPPAAPDWFAYEAALELAFEGLPPAPGTEEPGYRLRVRSADAALLLWERLIIGVEGYDTDADHNGLALIPLAHKEAAVRALTLVAPAEIPTSDDTAAAFPLRADEVPIMLEAVVAGRAFPRLVHRFRPPSVEDERAYRRLVAETLIVRGSRAPRTLIPARLPALVRLYDRLILSVEGYALHGQLLTEPEPITRAMDAWHKRAAVLALFGELTPQAPPPAGAAETELPA